MYIFVHQKVYTMLSVDVGKAVHIRHCSKICRPTSQVRMYELRQASSVDDFINNGLLVTRASDNVLVIRGDVTTEH